MVGDSLFSLLALVVTLGVLITVHEFGHFWVARRCGVKVLRFSVGFGYPLWRRIGADDVEYVIGAIPLGGYVKMLDERESVVPPAEAHRAFNRASVGRRIAIVAAGPAFNFAFAILAYAILFATGVSSVRPLLGDVVPGSAAASAGFRNGDEILRVAERPVRTLEDALLALVEFADGDSVLPVQVRDADGHVATRRLLAPDLGEAADGQVLSRLGLAPYRPLLLPVIGQLKPGGAAEASGLRPGDRVIGADDTRFRDWQEWAAYVRARPGQALAVQIERDGVPLTVAVTPATVQGARGPEGQIGAFAQVPPDLAANLRVVVRYEPFDAVIAAVGKTWDMSVFTLRMLGRMLVGRASLENISGPLTIAQMAGQSASIGASAFLSFLALVSVSLGVLNLLPIPVLDGGHLAYYLFELVKGSPVSEAVQNVGQRLGLAVLLMMMGLAFYNDLARLFGSP